MAPSLEQKLAQVNGVVIPSPRPAEQQPLKALKTSPPATKLDSIRTKTCPICGHAATKSRNIRVHFLTCVKRNGNPTGARWDDNLSFEPRPHLRKRKHDESANTSKKPTRTQNTAEQRSERQRRFHERLATVNGIISPSKIPPGETAPRRNFRTSQGRRYACPICGGLHSKRYHVQSHFAACVERNGNPTGARWDDACSGGAAASRVGSAVSTEFSSMTTPNLQPADHDHDHEIAAFDNAPTNPFQLNDYHQHSESPPSSSSSSPNSLELSIPHNYQYPDPELIAFTSQPYALYHKTPTNKA